MTLPSELKEFALTIQDAEDERALDLFEIETVKQLVEYLRQRIPGSHTLLRRVNERCLLDEVLYHYPVIKKAVEVLEFCHYRVSVMPDQEILRLIVW